MTDNRHKHDSAVIHQTIKALQVCKSAHSQVISNMEEYAKMLEGDESGVASGYQYGYVAELEYLNDRKATLDALIESIERYEAVRQPALSMATGAGR